MMLHGRSSPSSIGPSFSGTIDKETLMLNLKAGEWISKPERVPAVTLAFLYDVPTDNNCPAWEIKNVSFNAGTSPTNPLGIENPTINQIPISVRVANGELFIDSLGPYETVIYDISGRVIARCYSTPQVAIPLPSSGTYIISSGGYSQKIVITNLK